MPDSAIKPTPAEIDSGMARKPVAVLLSAERY